MIHKDANGNDSYYYQLFQKLFIIEGNKNLKLPQKFENKIYCYLGTYSLYKIFKPIERAMHRNPNQWTWQENPKGYINEDWMKKHLSLLIEENYEHEINSIIYEFSIKGNHVVNKIKDNNKHNYFYIIEKILALYEQKLFGCSDIQNGIYLKYEDQLNRKMNVNRALANER